MLFAFHVGLKYVNFTKQTLTVNVKASRSLCIGDNNVNCCDKMKTTQLKYLSGPHVELYGILVSWKKTFTSTYRSAGIPTSEIYETGCSSGYLTVPPQTREMMNGSH